MSKAISILFVAAIVVVSGCTSGRPVVDTVPASAARAAGTMPLTLEGGRPSGMVLMPDQRLRPRARYQDGVIVYTTGVDYYLVDHDAWRVYQPEDASAGALASQRAATLTIEERQRELDNEKAKAIQAGEQAAAAERAAVAASVADLKRTVDMQRQQIAALTAALAASATSAAVAAPAEVEKAEK